MLKNIVSVEVVTSGLTLERNTNKIRHVRALQREKGCVRLGVGDDGHVEHQARQ